MPFVKQEPVVLKFPIFEQCSSKGSEPFSLLICHDATKFVLLSVFTVIDRICQNICSKSRLKSEKNVHFWLTYVTHSNSLLPCPGITILKSSKFTWIGLIGQMGCIQHLPSNKWDINGVGWGGGKGGSLGNSVRLQVAAVNELSRCVKICIL